MFEIKTERLLLLPFKPDDAKEYFDIINDADIDKFLAHAYSSTYAETCKLVTDYSKADFENVFCFKITLKATGEIIGSITARKTEQTLLSLSYLIGKNFRGNGYMKEALHGFVNTIPPGYKFLYLDIMTDNTASHHVAKACGAKKLVADGHTNTFLIRIDDPLERL